MAKGNKTGELVYRTYLPGQGVYYKRDIWDLFNKYQGKEKGYSGDKHGVAIIYA